MSAHSKKGGQTVVDRLQAAIHTIDGSEMAKTVCKASTHEMAGPKPKHLTTLVAMSKAYNINQPELINLIILRTKEKSWVVVLKALITCHHLMIFGSEKVFQVMAARNVVFSLDGFSDHLDYDMSTFIRTYQTYLNERSLAYRSMAGDFCKMKRGENNEWKKMDDKKLIDSVSILQSLLDKLTNCSAPHLRNPVIISAFELIYKDIIKMFSPYNESMIQIMERLTKMRLTQAKPAFEIYKKFLAHLSTFKGFFEQAASLGITKSDIPDIQEGPAKLLPMFEKHLEDLEAGRVTVDSSASSPTKVASTTTSPTAGLSLQQQVLEEEKKALESYSKGRGNQSPTQAVIKLPQPTNPAKPATQPGEKPDYSADLLNLGSEITFGASTLSNINQQQPNQSQPQQTFSQDPFSDMFSQQRTAPSTATSNPFEAALNNNNNTAVTTASAGPVNSNPFANPFAAAAIPAASPFGAPPSQTNFGAGPTQPMGGAPVASPMASFNMNSFSAAPPATNTAPIGGLPGAMPPLGLNGGLAAGAMTAPNAMPHNANSMNSMNNMNTMNSMNIMNNQTVNNGNANTTQNSSAFGSDPFAGFLQPGAGGAQSQTLASNIANNGTMSTASKSQNNNNMFGSNLDDTLNNMMSNFSVTPGGGAGQNNPFAI